VDTHSRWQQTKGIDVTCRPLLDVVASASSKSLVPMWLAGTTGVGVLILFFAVLVFRLYSFEPRMSTSGIKTMVVLGSGVQPACKH
jgi:hypothetical protein